MRDALFMGRMTAQATHEMQNILATIRESAGLMEDLLAMGGEGFAHAERFKKGLGVLAAQVERGMTLSEQLNYCAHAPEVCPAGSEVNDALRALAVLFTRIAARHRVRLAFAPGRAGLRTSLRAVEVMDLAGLALDCALPLLARDAELCLRAVAQGQAPALPAATLPKGDGDPAAAKIRDHTVWIDGAERPAVIYDRARLRQGDVIEGPAIITEMDSTTLVEHD